VIPGAKLREYQRLFFKKRYKEMMPAGRVEPLHQAKQSPFIRGFELVPAQDSEPQAYCLQVRETVDINPWLRLAIFTNNPENAANRGFFVSL
jgi:hypothetical protein